MVTSVRRFRNACLIGGLALLAGTVPSRAENAGQAPPACWFYNYQWAYFRMVPNTAPPTSFPTTGVGTGVMVTDGRPPSAAETEAIAADIQHTLPQGDQGAPPPRAIVQSVNRIACPQHLEGVSLSVAKIILRQPEPLPPAAEKPGRIELRRSTR